MKLISFGLLFLFINFSIAQNFQWAGAVSGKSYENIMSSCTDVSGNFYATGSFQDTVDFDPGLGVNNLIADQNSDIFILKLNANGNFVWAKSVKSNGWDRGNSIAVDVNGNIIVVGFYNGSADFDPGLGTFSLTPVLGSQDAFILKLNSSGNFVWAQSLGGSNSEDINNLLTDSQGNIYFSGTFDISTDLDPGPASFIITANSGSIDFFIDKLDQAGNFIWGKTIGGPKTENCTSLEMDGSGNLFALGTFSATVDFDPGAGTVNKTSNGGDDLFIVKLNNSGNFVWVNTFGGPTNEISCTLKTDAFGNCYTSSCFGGTVDFDPSVTGSFVLSSNGGVYDGCVQKFDNGGNFVWAKQIGGGANSGVFLEDLVINANSDVFLTGFFEGTVDFNPTVLIDTLTAGGVDDAFVQAFDKDGNLIWIKSLGSNGNDRGTSLCLDLNNNIFISGTFQFTVDFDFGVGTYNLSANFISDVFVLKLIQNTSTIIENVTKINATVFPNPTAGDLIIAFDKEYKTVEIEFTNIAGQVLMKKVEPFTGKIIDLKIDAPAGLYILSIKGDGTKSSKFKIIKT